MLRGFLRRHPELTPKKPVISDEERVVPATPENLAAHFARLRAICLKHNISDPCFLFSADESGFPVRGMTRGERGKVVVSKKGKVLMREPKFRGTVDHVTVMPVVSAAGQTYSPVIVLPGARGRWRKTSDGSVQTPYNFLPPGSRVHWRPVAGVDSDIFHSWGQRLVKETEHLRSEGRRVLLIIDCHSGHVQYK